MRQLAIAGAVAVLAACIAPATAFAFSASFKWCSKTPQSTTSPAFSLSGVPKGTKSLELTMTDHQSAYNHGGGTVAYNGARSLPCGAIASGWVGPFPPNGETHTYEFTLKALDGGGKALGEAHATRKFPE
jgi:phosphatidylethanolamine-binding protein (PEBP) family uncharacterized protein